MTETTILRDAIIIAYFKYDGRAIIWQLTEECFEALEAAGIDAGEYFDTAAAFEDKETGLYLCNVEIVGERNLKTFGQPFGMSRDYLEILSRRLIDVRELASPDLRKYEQGYSLVWV